MGLLVVNIERIRGGGVVTIKWKIRNRFEALHLGEHSVNQCMQFDPCCISALINMPHSPLFPLYINNQQPQSLLCTSITPPEDDLQHQIQKCVMKSPCPEEAFCFQIFYSGCPSSRYFTYTFNTHASNTSNTCINTYASNYVCLIKCYSWIPCN